jgi:preprotein translocase subunit SecA
VQWQNGLHQFLEIKHGLQVNTEGMTSNFISNLGHFDKYPYLYGLTGTMGSSQSKEFLRETYQTNLFMVPPYKARRLQVELGKVLYD